MSQLEEVLQYQIDLNKVWIVLEGGIDHILKLCTTHREDNLNPLINLLV